MKYSIVHPYYNHSETILKHIPMWKSLHLKHHSVELILVDDYSYPDRRVDVSLLKNLHMPCSVYFIEKDIAWNVAGARNLGAKMAQGEYLLMSDMDMIVMPSLLNHVNQNANTENKKRIFQPRLQTNANANKFPPFGKTSAPHCNSFIMNRQFYWEIGGYDEDFAGGWGSEDSYFRHLCRKNGAIFEELQDPGYLFYLQDEQVGERYSRRYRASANWLIYKKKLTQYLMKNNTPILRFPYSQVYKSGY